MHIYIAILSTGTNLLINTISIEDLFYSATESGLPLSQKNVQATTLASLVGLLVENH